MDFRELKSFVYVVENESVTLASKKLYMTQPAISKHIKILEDELSENLFIKSKRKVVPTKAGLQLYNYAKKILNLEKELNKSLKETDKAFIKVGVSSVPSLICLPEILGSYKKKNKNIYFSIYQSDSKNVIDALKNDIIDVGFVGMETKEKDISCTAFYKDSLVLIMPNNIEYKKILKKSKQNLIKELFNKPFIMREDGSGSKKNIVKMLDKLSIDINLLDIIGEINSQDVILELVKKGLGVSIVSKKVALDKKYKGDFLIYDFPNTNNDRNLNVICKANKNKKYIKDFITYVKNFYK